MSATFSNTRISQLPAATGLTGSELIPMDQGNSTVAGTLNAIPAGLTQPVVVFGGSGSPFPNYRTLTAGFNVSITDGGPQGSLTIALIGTGTGDVVGPASAVDGQAVVFNGVSGKLIKANTDSGVAHLTAGVLAADDNFIYTGGKVGIGGADMVAPLNVNGDSAYGQVAFYNSPNTGNYGGIGIEGSDGEIIVGSTKGDLSIWSSDGHINFSANAGSNVQMSITAATGVVNIAGLTASQLTATDASKNLQSLTTATYPSLTEVSYVKGVTSAIQTQLNSKASSTLTNTHIFVGNSSNVATDVALSGDATLANTGVLTLATVNSNVGSFGSATQAGTFTVDGKGRLTAAGSTTVTPAIGSVTGLGTGIATALAVNVGTAGSPVVNGGALGTPSSGTATNLTGTATALNIGGNAATATTASTASAVAVGGITGLGTGVATALAVNVGSAGAFVVNGGALGIPSSGVATNLTGTASGLTAGNVTTNANLTGVITSAGNATSIASQTGTGTKFVVDNTPTLITPLLGTPTSGNLSNCTALPTTALTGALQAAQEPAHTGDVINTAGSLALNNVSVGGYQVAGFRNALINGQMSVWQRGTSFTPSASTVTMTADRWAVKRNTVVNWTVTQQTTTPPAGFTNYMRVQRTNATSDTQQISIVQMVETVDAIKWANVPIVFSFYARCGANYSPTSSLMTARVQSGTGTNEIYTAYTGSSNDISQNATLTTSFQRFSYAGTLQSGTTEFCAFLFFTPTGTAGAADYVDITGVQIEPATAAANVTPYEFQTYGDTLQRCRRYYQKSFPQATAPAQNAGVAGAITVKNPIALGDPSEYIQFCPPMAPLTNTFTTYNPSAGNANWRDITAAADVTVSVDPGSTKSETGILVATSGTVTTLGDILAIHYTASAEVAGVV